MLQSAYVELRATSSCFSFFLVPVLDLQVGLTSEGTRQNRFGVSVILSDGKESSTDQSNTMRFTSISNTSQWKVSPARQIARLAQDFNVWQEHCTWNHWNHVMSPLSFHMWNNGWFCKGSIYISTTEKLEYSLQLFWLVYKDQVHKKMFHGFWGKVEVLHNLLFVSEFCRTNE